MLIGGMQKMTLLDFPGKVACIIFTHGCNLRCPYCHNAPLVTGAYEGISEDEVFSFLKKRTGILDGVCISGGEPLLQKDILSFMERVGALGYSVKLDTNGTSPDRLREAVASGLCDYVAMDIKNSREKYRATVGADVSMADIERSVSYLLSGAVEYEFRTTVTRELHTAEDMQRIGRWISGADRYFLQKYVEGEGHVGGGMSAPADAEMAALADAVREFVPSVLVR